MSGQSNRWLSRALMTSSASPPGPGHSDELAAAAAVRRRCIGLVDGATVITDHLGHLVGGWPAPFRKLTVQAANTSAQVSVGLSRSLTDSHTRTAFCQPELGAAESERLLRARQTDDCQVMTADAPRCLTPGVSGVMASTILLALALVAGKRRRLLGVSTGVRGVCPHTHAEQAPPTSAS